MTTEQALANLRHLYQQMIAGQVADVGAAARSLLGPAIEGIEAECSDRQNFERLLDAAAREEQQVLGEQAHGEQAHRRATREIVERLLPETARVIHAIIQVTDLRSIVVTDHSIVGDFLPVGGDSSLLLQLADALEMPIREDTPIWKLALELRLHGGPEEKDPGD